MPGDARDLETPLLAGAPSDELKEERPGLSARHSSLLPLGRAGMHTPPLSECSNFEHILMAEEELVRPTPDGCNTSGGMANLVTTAVGAGMLALPKAVSETGIVLGSLLFALVACLTYASCSIIVRYAARRGVVSYGELVRQHFGARGAALLQCAIAVHVAGVMIGYCVIISDILVGSAPRYEGVLPTLLGRHDGVWWLSRPAVLAALLGAVVVPTLVPRSLNAVARFSAFSVCMLFLLASAISGLAVAAIAEGAVAPSVHWLPDPGTMGGGTPLGALSSVLTVISVAALAFTCQFNLLPIQASLRDDTSKGMHRVLALGLAFCAALYGAVAVSGYALFGAATEGDVLKNLTAGFVATLVPSSLAHAVVYGVAISYTLCLLANFVLKVWAVREAVVELAVCQSAAELAATPFYALTYVLVVAAYGISVLVPSIYGLLALTGATATVVFSYVYPSLIVLKDAPSSVQRAGAFALLFIGGTMTVTAIANHLAGRSLE